VKLSVLQRCLLCGRRECTRGVGAKEMLVAWLSVLERCLLCGRRECTRGVGAEERFLVWLSVLKRCLLCGKRGCTRRVGAEEMLGALAVTRYYFHHQYCMVYGIHKRGAVGRAPAAKWACNSIAIG